VTESDIPGGMNGRQMAKAARALRPERKVLFIIGYAENAAVGNGHLEPGMQVLTKLFAIDSWPRQNPAFHHQHAISTFALPWGFRGRVCRMAAIYLPAIRPAPEAQDHWHSIVAGR
jgi:hypothetical protein